MGRNPWVARSDGYPKGAKVWYTDSSDTTKTGEYVSTMDANVSTPGGTDVIPETATLQWIKLNDLSGTSGGGSTVTCGWDATKIGNIISSLSSLSSSITDIQTDIDNLNTSITNLDTKVTNIEGDSLFFDTGVYTYEYQSFAQYESQGLMYVTLPDKYCKICAVTEHLGTESIEYYIKTSAQKKDSTSTDYNKVLKMYLDLTSLPTGWIVGGTTVWAVTSALAASQLFYCYAS